LRIRQAGRAPSLGYRLTTNGSSSGQPSACHSSRGAPSWGCERSCGRHWLDYASRQVRRPTRFTRRGYRELRRRKHFVLQRRGIILPHIGYLGNSIRTVFRCATSAPIWSRRSRPMRARLAPTHTCYIRSSGGSGSPRRNCRNEPQSEHEARCRVAQCWVNKVKDSQ